MYFVASVFLGLSMVCLEEAEALTPLPLLPESF